MKKRILNKSLLLATGLFLLANSAWATDTVATASGGGSIIEWTPNVNSTIVLEVVNGFEFTHREVFTDSAPYFSSIEGGRNLNDGQYNYQLTGSASADGQGETLRQSGSFEVINGNITLSDDSSDE